MLPRSTIASRKNDEDVVESAELDTKDGKSSGGIYAVDVRNVKSRGVCILIAIEALEIVGNT